MNNKLTTDICFSQAPLDVSDINPVFSDSRLKAVVVGGGSGAPVSIRSLLALGIQTDAVVAMADDGGSTGILRKELDATPPGDVRNCLAAFAQNPQGPIAQLFQTRFSFANDHALGNLIISSLEQNTGSFKEALLQCETILNAQGHVLPSTFTKVNLVAKTVSGSTIFGQSLANNSIETLDSIILESENPILANPDAVEALLRADIVVLGPGSLFTSIIPNLVIEPISAAIQKSHAVVIAVLPLADYQGESLGLSAQACVDALERHGLSRRINYAFVHDPVDYLTPKTSGIGFDNESQNYLSEHHIQSVVCDFSDHEHDGWHNPAALARAITKVVDKCHLPLK